MKKVSLILVVVLLLSLAASVSAEREFIDSTGRTVIVPDEIEKVFYKNVLRVYKTVLG